MELADTKRLFNENWSAVLHYCALDSTLIRHRISKCNDIHAVALCWPSSDTLARYTSVHALTPVDNTSEIDLFDARAQTFI